MASRLARRLASGVRALPGTGAGLGMAVPAPTGRGPVKAATTSTTYVTPGQPLYQEFDAQNATRLGYLAHTYVMRCVRVRAETVGSLPFRCGPDPDDPSTYDPAAGLARLLGPASPQAPGGPNPTTTARALWIWSIVQRIVTGRMAWELQLDPDDRQGAPTALWPLVSAALDPVPSPPGSQRWFDGFQYRTPLGVIPLDRSQVMYAWRMAAEDPRQAESVLQAAQLPIQVAVACDRYMWSLLKNGMVASKIVIAPPFADPADRRAWEDQFFSEFSGYDNAGKTIFAEAENDYDGQGRLVDQASVQVVDLSMKSTDAQLFDMIKMAKTDIEVAIGVPESLIGNASQRIYANANSEYRNFWTLTALSDVAELEDDVNLWLAPRLGDGNYGWFDLSHVVALQPPQIFQPPAIKDAIDEGVITPQQASDLLGIPNLAATGEDVETAPIGEEAIQSGAMGGRSLATSHRALRPYGQGSWRVELPDGWGFRHRPVTRHTLRQCTAGWGIVRVPRPRISVSSGVRSAPALAQDVTALVARCRRRRTSGGVEGERSAPALSDEELDDLDCLGDRLTVAGL